MPYKSKYFPNPDEVKLSWWNRCLSQAATENPFKYGRKLSAAEIATDFAESWNRVDQTKSGKSQCEQALNYYRSGYTELPANLPIRTPFIRPGTTPIKRNSPSILPRLPIQKRSLNMPSPKSTPLPENQTLNPFSNATDEDEYTMEDFISEIEARQSQFPNENQPVSTEKIKKFFE